MTNLTAYQAPVFDEAIDLDLSRNEGVPGTIDHDALHFDLHRLVSRYPDTTPLRHLIATMRGVGTRQVLVTAGGDGALARCFQSFSGSTVVTTTPSFEMIALYAAQTGSELIEVPWWTGRFPTDEFSSAAADVAVIVSPNNPTGAVIDAGTLNRVASTFSLVVLDAAYAEFADIDLTETALSLGNVLVTRTLSKAYGLAGLRVGYVIGPAGQIADLARFGSPYPVSSISVRLAETALARGGTDVGGVAERRDQLIALLEELGMAPLPSQANFVLATRTRPDWLVGACSALGIAIRSFPGRIGLERSVRITVPRTKAEMHRLRNALLSIMRPEALLFDLDGVIADVSASYRHAIVATAGSFGVKVRQADVERVKGNGGANDDWEVTRLLCEEKGMSPSYEAVVERFETLYQGSPSTIGLKTRERPLVDAATLETLAGRLPLAIVTGRPRRDAIEFLDRFGLGAFFETVVTREDAPMKPDPTPVRLALDRLGVSHAWMLGDTRDDLEAARAAGVMPIGVGPEPIRPAAAVLETAASIKELLDDTIC